MAKLLGLDANGDIRWPALCASCGSSSDLTVANATSGRVKSVRPNIAGGLSISSEVLNLSYPVCPQHAKGLALANQITRNTGGVKILRGLIYFIGGVGLLSFAASSLSLVLGALSSAQKRPSDVPLTFVVLNALFAVALVWTILAFNKVPVRVTGQSADVIRLKFKSERYAREFAKLNRAVLR